MPLLRIFKQCGTIFDRVHLDQDVRALQTRVEAPDFWSAPKEAEKVMKTLKSKEKMLSNLNSLLKDFSDYRAMAEELDDQELQPMIEDFLNRLERQKIALFLAGPYDDHNAIVSIYAGAGGKDAQDFADMLLRMIVRFCEQEGWAVTIVDRNEGEEVGIKSVTLEIHGTMVYGLLQSEHGVHRLVRLSPFNAGNTRETSFAKIDVLPLIENDLLVEIPAEDLRIDVFRAGGKGGQGVNTTDSAVRLTHIPTGVVVTCQNERSQLQNKNTAMKLLVSKLMKLKEQQQVSQLKDLKGPKQEAAWGNQIRSYVLHPYQMVKDHRTEAETSQTEKVLNGDLRMFIEAYVRQK
jgi:peptide chain release factor 2